MNYNFLPVINNKDADTANEHFFTFPHKVIKSAIKREQQKKEKDRYPDYACYTGDDSPYDQVQQQSSLKCFISHSLIIPPLRRFPVNKLKKVIQFTGP